MSHYDRIAWKEGTLLVPQHFQQAERSLEASLNLRLQADHPLAAGILQVNFDEAALRHERLRLLRCKAVLSDGTTINIPDTDEAPPERPIKLKPGSSSVDVHLCIPAYGEGMVMMTEDPKRVDIRYVSRPRVDVSDEFDRDRKQDIDIAVKNLQLMLSGEVGEGFVSLPIAQVYRSSDGHLAFRDDFVPPALRIGASPRLVRLVKELLNLIEGRADILAELRRPGEQGLDMKSVEGAQLWLLHILNQEFPVLRHLSELPNTHPARLYEELLRLAGGLSTIAREKLRAPSYDHGALFDCFHTLDRYIRRLLSLLSPSHYERIELTRQKDFWFAHISDPEILKGGEFIFAVTSDLGRGELVSRLPGNFKIAEKRNIQNVFLNAVPGLAVAPLDEAPPGVPVRSEASYFRLNAKGDEWERIRASGDLAAYVPTFLPNVKPELFVIRPGGNR